ncbi:MAG: fatty acid CoA ligase family protein [Pseudomonadota bacterium]
MALDVSENVPMERLAKKDILGSGLGVRNIASLIDAQCQDHPETIAVSAKGSSSWDRSPREKGSQATDTSWEHLSYGDLKVKSDHLAARLRGLGFQRGMRTLLFVRPGLDFPVLVTALFKIGVTLVLIDPGMGRKNLLKAISEVKPEAMIAVSEVFLASFLFRRRFSTVKLAVVVKDRWSLGSMFAGSATDLKTLLLAPGEKALGFESLHPRSEETCAILFTSGGTGIPKGVMYTHGIFLRQVELIQQMYGVGKQDVDMPCFPLFALFSLALGARVIVPELDPTRPAAADPKKLIQTIGEFGVTFAGGSPAIWSKVASYALSKSLSLPSLRSLMMFGAPVRYHIHDQFSKILPNGTTYTPYGATECLPVASISGREIIEEHLKDRASEGTCVGEPVPGLEVKIIRASSKPLANVDDVEFLPSGEIGEIICKGPQVTSSYFERPEANAKAKIKEGSQVWHRMGDMGWLDVEGRLWFCGRQAYSFSYKGTMFYSVLVEAPFNRHPEIFRTALISLETKDGIRPALAIERHDQQVSLKSSKRQEFLAQLHVLGQTSAEASVIEDFFLVKSFPVDVRHNIKIDRTRLGKELSRTRKGYLP